LPSRPPRLGAWRSSRFHHHDAFLEPELQASTSDGPQPTLASWTPRRHPGGNPKIEEDRSLLAARRGEDSARPLQGARRHL